LLVAANHPGAADGLVIAAALRRDDLKVVISDVPFTRAVPYGRKYLIYTPSNIGACVRRAGGGPAPTEQRHSSRFS
jgi:hypothetical protein